MNKQVLYLCRLQICNLFGINELRYTKDKSKRNRTLGLAVVWALLVVMLIFYVGALSYGLVLMGLADIVPMYLYTIVSLIMLFLTFFKAGSILFSMKGYEMLVALPLPRNAIVLSRFFGMYVTNLLAGFLVMIPGIVVYGYFEGPGVGFYVLSLIGTLFLPLLPLTIASILGAGITAISARVKHKSIGEALLMVAVVVVVMGSSFFLEDATTQMDINAIKNMAETLGEQIGSLYPPSLWFKEALDGNMVSFVMLILIPVVVFVLFIAVIQKYFHAICAALNAVSAKNNYKMEHLQANGVVKALWKKELKRYFASSSYLTNTIVGYVLAVLAAVALFAVGIEQMEALFGISRVGKVVIRVLPYVLSCLFGMTSMTSCAISMEGAGFWQIQTLPVKSKEVYDSKIMVNLSVAAPFYVVSVVFSCLAVRPSLPEAVWLILIPAAYLLFMAVSGITINLAFPVLNWENEVRVVKQSASTLVTMLIGIGSSILPAVAVGFSDGALTNILNMVIVLVLLGMTAILYQKNNKKELIDI